MLRCTASTTRAKRFTCRRRSATRPSPKARKCCATSAAPASPRADRFLRRTGALTFLLQVRLVDLHVGLRFETGDVGRDEFAAHLLADAVADRRQPRRVRRRWRDDPLDPID